MSKIGKINISIPEKVKVALSGNVLNVEGPLGKKSLNIDLDIFSIYTKEFIRTGCGRAGCVCSRRESAHLSNHS